MKFIGNSRATIQLPHAMCHVETGCSMEVHQLICIIRRKTIWDIFDGWLPLLSAPLFRNRLIRRLHHLSVIHAIIYELIYYH